MWRSHLSLCTGALLFGRHCRLVPVLLGGEGDELLAGEAALVAELAEARVAELAPDLRRQRVLVLGRALPHQLLA